MISKTYKNKECNHKVQKNKKLLEVKDFSISFIQYETGLKQRQLKVINNLDIEIDSGEIVAILGSSGSGKSLLAHAILGILPDNACVSGTISYLGEPLTDKRLKEIRGREITLIPQSVNYLDPLMRIGKQVRNGISEGDPIQIQRDIFKRYSLKVEDERLFPFQISGGMARRVLVSAAMVGGAQLIIADEPTPGLHPEVVEETLKHLRELADEGCGILMITHDIEAALKIANRIAVFYAGTTIEVAPVKDFKDEGELLRHPYTKALWKALPQNGFKPILGFQPTPNDLPSGCLFEPRCHKKTSECALKNPEMCELRGGTVRCYHAT